MDARGFTKELQRWVREDVKGRATKHYRTIVQDLGSSIIRDTPVDTGQARGNWRFTTSRVSSSYSASYLDPTGSKAQSRLRGVTARLQLWDPVYIANNAPYIERLEHGWSRQAPAGMLAKNIARVISKYRILK